MDQIKKTCDIHGELSPENIIIYRSRAKIKDGKEIWLQKYCRICRTDYKIIKYKERQQNVELSPRSPGVIKICAKHGELKESDIYHSTFKKKNVSGIATYKKMHCKYCNKENSKRQREKGYKKAYDEKYYAEKKSDPAHIEYKKEYERKRWLEKKEEITKKRQTTEAKAKRRQWYEANIERERNRCKKMQKEYIKNLHPTYVKRRIIEKQEIKMTHDEIPPEMVETKKQLLILNRDIKKILKKKYSNKEGRTVR